LWIAKRCLLKEIDEEEIGVEVNTASSRTTKAEWQSAIRDCSVSSEGVNFDRCGERIEEMEQAGRKTLAISSGAGSGGESRTLLLQDIASIHIT
jgi:hypothetical protein